MPWGAHRYRTEKIAFFISKEKDIVSASTLPKDLVLLHFRTPLGLGLGLQLALSHVSNRNPTPNPKGVRKCNSAKDIICYHF